MSTSRQPDGQHDGANLRLAIDGEPMPRGDVVERPFAPETGKRRISFVAWGVAGIVSLGLWVLIFKLAA